MEQRNVNGFMGMYEGHIVDVATALDTCVEFSITPPRPRPECYFRFAFSVCEWQSPFVPSTSFVDIHWGFKTGQQL